MKYHVTRNSLGPYCADLFIYHDVRLRVNQVVFQLENAWREKLGDVLISLAEEEHNLAPMEVDDPSIPSEHPIPVDLEQIDAILSDFQPWFESCAPLSPSSSSPTSTTMPFVSMADSMPHQERSTLPRVPISVPLTWCSPKVKALTEVLLEYFTPTFHGIVFVEQRQVAACLAKILGYVPELQGKIRCAELVGHGGGHGSGRHCGGSARSRAVGSGRADVKGMGLAKQHDTVKMFREGDLNLRRFLTSCW